MLYHHGVIIVTIMLLPLILVDNSYMARHYGQILLIVDGVQCVRAVCRLVVLVENKLS